MICEVYKRTKVSFIPLKILTEYQHKKAAEFLRLFKVLLFYYDAFAGHFVGFFDIHKVKHCGSQIAQLAAL